MQTRLFFNATEEADRLLKVHDILCQTYGAPFPYFSTKGPLDTLVSALLSHRTRNAHTAVAYQALRQAFPDWNDLLTAPASQIATLIQVVTYPEQKAARIPDILRYIKTYNKGVLSLDFLTTMPIQTARQWLENIPGVGAKTSAAVLNFSTLRLPALVADSHHFRVVERLGFVTAKTPVSEAAYQLEQYLPKDWKGREYYDHHEALMYHGQHCCHYKDPACGRCPIRQYCQYPKQTS